jgi:hypothetical protein
LAVNPVASVASTSGSVPLAVASPKSSSLTPCFRDQDVQRFQIAVRDAFAVRRVERVQNLRRVVDGLLQRKRSAERSAVDELHHEIIGPDVVELADVRMIERRDESRFALESLAERRTRHFDRHVAIEARIGRAVDVAHAAGSQEGVDPVRTEQVAGRQRGERFDELRGGLRSPGLDAGVLLVIGEQREHVALQRAVAVARVANECAAPGDVLAQRLVKDLFSSPEMFHGRLSWLRTTPCAAMPGRNSSRG